MGRPRIIDAVDIARSMAETFKARDVEWEERFSFTWPSRLQNIGDSLAVAYSSDKWKDKSWSGRREVEDFKHVAESRNRVLAVSGLLRDYFTKRTWPVIGPTVSFAGVPMPREFACLGDFREASLALHVAGDDDAPRFGRGDAGVLKLTLADAHVGGSKIRWSVDDPGARDQPFLFVYDLSGIKLVIVGEKLDVERDGIVG